MSASFNIILFASGRGSNVQAILDYFKNTPAFQPKLIVCNKPDIGAIEIAVAHNIPYIVIDRHYFNSVEFLDKINAIQPSLLILAGFLWKIPEALVQQYPSQIINIHPALLPKYGGKGMYGMNVHETVLVNKETESGITIHYVNENYDEGHYITQAYCKVSATDTAVTLAQKIHELEHFYFPRTIAFLLKLL
jgi:phosphoribosylglycinamide formyltransferase-1